MPAVGGFGRHGSRAHRSRQAAADLYLPGPALSAEDGGTDLTVGALVLREPVANGLLTDLTRADPKRAITGQHESPRNGRRGEASMDLAQPGSMARSALQNRVVSRKRDGRFDSFPSPPTLKDSATWAIFVARESIFPRQPRCARPFANLLQISRSSDHAHPSVAECPVDPTSRFVLHAWEHVTVYVECDSNRGMA